MRRTLTVLVVLILVVLLAAGGYFNYQKLQADAQERAAEIAELNNLRARLSGLRPGVYDSEIALRNVVLLTSLYYERVLTLAEQKELTVGPLELDCRFCPFRSDYTRYLTLLHDYNTLAAEINYEATRVGEPPVLLLEQYDPILP